MRDVLALESSNAKTSASIEAARNLIASWKAEQEAGRPTAVIGDFEAREGHLLTVTRAISARVNQNFDGFPSEELHKAYATFLGKPVFVNHANHDPSKARGRVVAARYVENDVDKYIDVIQEVNAKKYPKLAQELLDGGLDSVSMGCEAARTICSFCGNTATGMFDMCAHVANAKGRYLRRKAANGQMEDVLVYEECRDLGFFELSYVFDPADETAVVSTVLTASKKKEAILRGQRVWCDLPGCRRWAPYKGEAYDNEWVTGGGEMRTYDYCCEGHRDDFEARFPNWAFEATVRNPHKRAELNKISFGEVEAPPPVDTLRDEGEEETDEFHRYVEAPPELSMPDLDKAKQIDRREEMGEGFENFDSELIEEDEPLSEDDGLMADPGDPANPGDPNAPVELIEDPALGPVDSIQPQTGPPAGAPAEGVPVPGEDDVATAPAAPNPAPNIPTEPPANPHKRDLPAEQSDPAEVPAEDSAEVDPVEVDPGDAAPVDTDEQTGLPEDSADQFDDPADDGAIPELSSPEVDAPDSLAETPNTDESDDGPVPTDVIDETESDDDSLFDDPGVDDSEIDDTAVGDDEVSEGPIPQDVIDMYENENDSDPEDEDDEDKPVKPKPVRNSASRTGNRVPTRGNEQGNISTKGHTMGTNSLAQRGRVASRGRVADQSRNDQGEKEDTFITQTPPEEPVETADGDEITNTENNLVARIRADQARLKRIRARKGNRKQAEETPTVVNPELSGTDEQELKGDFESADPNDGVEETQPKDAAVRSANRYRHFAAWVRKTHKRPVREARNAGELRRWASSYATQYKVDPQSIYTLLSRDLTALRRKAGEEGVAAPSRADANDVKDSIKNARRKRAGDDDGPPDFIQDKIDGKDDDSDDKKESAARARAAQRRKMADDKLDVAAPDGRVDVEAPTSGTTDDEAQASQFDKGDFGDNAGDDLADPDLKTDQNFAPGEGKRSSRMRQASGLQAVRLAEAMVAAGLDENNEGRWALANRFEKMSASVVADRTSLLEAVIAKHDLGSERKTAGVRGSSRVARTAVPANLGRQAATTASAPVREAGNGSAPGNPDSDMFL